MTRFNAVGSYKSIFVFFYLLLGFIFSANFKKIFIRHKIPFTRIRNLLYSGYLVDKKRFAHIPNISL